MILLNKFCYVFYRSRNTDGCKIYETKEWFIVDYSDTKQITFNHYELIIYNLRFVKQYHGIIMNIDYDTTRIVEDIYFRNFHDRSIKIEFFKKGIEINYTQTKYINF